MTSIFRVEGKHILFFLAWSTAICIAHIDSGWQLAIPFTAVGTLGTAVAIILGFKNNAAYERWWEARKIWGGFVNQSRFFASQLVAYVDKESAAAGEAQSIHEEFVYRHLGYLNTLRLMLRGSALSRESTQWLAKSDPDHEFVGANVATLINHRQAQRIKDLLDDGWFDKFRMFELMATNRAFFELQGSAERINNTPLMRHYSYFTSAFVWIFTLLLPFGFVNDLGWITIPVAVLISTIFTMLDRAGTFTEDPFANDFNDVPLDAICRTIELDMHGQLGIETSAQPLVAEDGILM